MLRYVDWRRLIVYGAPCPSLEALANVCGPNKTLTTVVTIDTSTVLGRMNRHEHALLTEEMTDLFASLSSHC